MARTRALAVALAGMLAGSAARASTEVFAEGEGLRFRVGSIGDAPRHQVGADVDNTLHLQGRGPAVMAGVSFGATRRVEVRWRRIEGNHEYTTAVPELVLNGEQRVSRDSVDLLIAQKVGVAPVWVELGYRYLDLGRSWHDAAGFPPEAYRFDRHSELAGHGLRGALGLDVRLVGPVRFEALLGLGVLRTHESGELRFDQDEPYGEWRSLLDGSRSLTMAEGSARLRANLGAHAWLAIGYRFEALYGGGEYGEFDARGPTLGAGIRFGGRR